LTAARQETEHLRLEAADLERTTQVRIVEATREAEDARRAAREALSSIRTKEEKLGDAEQRARELVDVAMREADKVRLDAEKILDSANERAVDTQAAIGRLRAKLKQDS
jgi:hypothetical protein